MWVDVDNLSKQQKRKLEHILKDNIMSRIKVKLLNEECMPERTHRWDAGWDLKAAEAVTIPAGKTCKVHTGVIFEIPARYFGMVVPRSSFGAKYRITLANDVGIIDSEYRGEVMVFLSNDSDTDFVIDMGVRFAQILIVPVNTAELWQVDKVSTTGRGDGGFGSTTKKKVFDSPGIVGNPCGEVSLGEPQETVLKLSEEDEKVIAENVAKEADAMVMEEGIQGQEVSTEVKRALAISELKALKPGEYMKLKNSGELFEKYPIATGDMKTDLGI